MQPIPPNPLTTAVVARPAFFPTCRGTPAVSALGPWVASAPPRNIWVEVGGALSWQEITPEAAKALLAGNAPAPAPAKAQAPAKPAAAPAKTAH